MQTKSRVWGGGVLYKSQARALGLFGAHSGPVWGPFGGHSGPVWGPIDFGAQLGLFGAHLGPGLQKSIFFLLPIQAWPWSLDELELLASVPSQRLYARLHGEADLLLLYRCLGSDHVNSIHV